MTSEHMPNHMGTRTAAAPARVVRLNAGSRLEHTWRAEVTSTLGLANDSFQLVTGAADLRVDDGSGLLAYSDLVVPKAGVARMSTRERNRRSAAYRRLLNALLPVTENGLRGVLGRHYGDWVSCRNADPGGIEHADLFWAWAQARLPGKLRDSAFSAYVSCEGDPSRRALDAATDSRNYRPFVRRDARIETLPIYSATNAQAMAATRHSAHRPIDFDSTEISETQPEFDFFGPGGSVLSKLGRRASGSRITVAGSVAAWGSTPTHPGAWCDEFELDRAWIAGDDPDVWDRAALGDNWELFFGANGFLARRVARIVTVRDFDLTVTSHARYTAAEAGFISAHARRGVWPLLASDGPPVHRQTVRHNSDGSLSIRMTLPKGRLQIWGGYISRAPD